MNIQRFEQIKDQLKNLTLAKQNKLTDFNDGSVISSIYEAIATVLEKFYIEVRNGFSQNLQKIAMGVFNFQKKQGTKANAFVVFSREKTSSKITTIPVSTRVSCGDYTFITTATGVIKEGKLDSELVPVQSEGVGLKYNVDANSITKIDSIVPIDVTRVNNPKKATGGTDEEKDTELQARFKLFVNGLQGGNEYGIKSAVLSIEGVRSVSIEEHVPPLDTGEGFTVYVDDGTGGLTKELQREIQDKIDGDDTSVSPGYRAAGVLGRVLPATVVPVQLKLTCYVWRVETAKALLEIREALEEEINGLGIAENVVLTTLILRLRRLGYVKDIKFELPEDNISIGLSQIARFDSVEIIIKEVDK